jgi:type I restriction enzyme M protein
MTINYIHQLLKALGFAPKNGREREYSKFYRDYELIINIDAKDIEKSTIQYGELIRCESKITSTFSQSENLVVLECVNKLLEKGYQPSNIILEKTWATGHGTSGRLDILVTRDDGSAYLMIECKTSGKEFEKELNKIKKDGGQLFTYFQQDRSADVLMLYASEMQKNQIIYKNEIIKIELEYRQTNNVKDFYERWSKLTKDNGVFDSWVKPYNFESKALTINDLVEIKQEDSSFIFNRFLEILRHNVVSDKGNAFNKIFTLFLCKIYDEKINEGTDNELSFQWYEKDDHISFQLRLTDLYKNGMHEFLEKVVTDFSETEFNNKFKDLDNAVKSDLLDQINKIRLEKNNEFAIKDVYDEQSFSENAVVVREIVELLQKFKLRYTKKQQYLSDFFELLLTTGLKQESGQFFTPVPLAQFIIKSLPIDQILENKLANAKLNNSELLPYVIDYASGSGHFITEIMHEFQRLLNEKDDKTYHSNVGKAIRRWKDDHFAWAIDYIYGIEKDYRLVRVGKVGCYLHGDGLANVIHSDGLAKFAHPDYKGKLSIKDENFPLENKQFDIVVSNPPYSVSSFKNTSSRYYQGNDFELYKSLTDNSSEIECLFIERTKQLLKDDGIAGIILPSSILSNTGIYTKAREIILKYFEIVGITELGSNTFMATGTNTVVLFLRRRNNYTPMNLKKLIDKVFINLQDITINSIEKPISKYINHVWESINFDDYISLLKSDPNEQIEKHEIYTEYSKKIKAKNNKEFFEIILEKEKEKLFYFVLTYPQKIVLIKTGEKDVEKRFLGYEFSNRRGSEGIHPIQRGKHIEDCTKLFDPEVFENPEKASTYIHKAFTNDFDFPIHESLENNISRHDLVDMLTFDRVDFEKTISLNIKKKVEIQSNWDSVKLESLAIMLKRGKSPKYGKSEIQIIKSGQARGFKEFDFSQKHYVEENFILDERQLEKGDILINSSGVGTAGRVTLFNLTGTFVVDSHITILRPDKTKVLPDFILQSLAKIGFKNIEAMADGQSGQIELTIPTIQNIKIPLPPINIQEKIVAEIKVLEQKEEKHKNEVESLREEINEVILNKDKTSLIYLSELCNKITDGSHNPPPKAESGFPMLSAKNIINNSIVFDDPRWITEEDFYGEDKRTQVQTKDILLTIVGAIGRVAIVPENCPPLTLQRSVAVLKHNQKINPEYLMYALRSKFIQDQLNEKSHGVAQKGVYLSDLKSLKIPVPLIEEQEEIVAKIEKIEERINELEKEISLTPSQKEIVLKKYL